MEPDPLWIAEAHRSHPLMHEHRLADVFGGVLLVVSLLAGIGCGVLGIVIGRSAFDAFPEALAIPFALPVAAAIVVRRNVLAGIAAGIFAAGLSLFVAALWGVLMIACFVITFMGECP